MIFFFLQIKKTLFHFVTCEVCFVFSYFVSELGASCNLSLILLLIILCGYYL